jgi:hypothetical protein
MNNSNKPADRVFLTSEFERLSASLDQARADVALLRRLKDAEKDAARIAGELAAVQDALVTANVDALSAARDAEFGNLRNLSIIATFGDKRAPSAISASYAITYERLTYDNAAHKSLWKSNSINGFSAVPMDVMRYLILAKPDAIPLAIMNLAPGGDAEEAFDAYFAAMRRGYMTTVAATPTLN